ncbi:PAS domain-containing hybrid sensor histidine kinase/response regulator [Cochlodiniinecator piscidefendens]|uniref:PAS domain-containing hybrid sensor histidine kinase/response regulator n=1 Tax=Cochlodiniinecator piscidefendens TaxID=2715756 RepID=UPI00140BD606|nr:PAS domain-containing hybrid sensor histidine kinase/response regulator [Cochlodiniinecator piscidefendens]
MQQDLNDFENAVSPKGLFLRYCRGRNRFMLSRQIVTLAGSAIVSYIIAPWYGLLTLIIGVIGETIDYAYLSYAIRKIAPQTDIAKYQKYATVTAAIQALSISFCVALVWLLGGASMHFFALTFLAGATMDAGTTGHFFPAATRAKFAVFLTSFVAMFFLEIREPHMGKHELLVDFVASAMFIFLLMHLLKFLYSFQRRSIDDAREIFTKNMEMERSNFALKEQEAQARNLALVAENANDSVVICDPNGRITWVNATFTKVTGYTPEDAIGSDVGELLNAPETSQETIEKIINASMNSEAIRVEVLNKTKSGARIWIEANITPVFDDNGHHIMNVSVERDISEAKKREQELAEAKQETERVAGVKAEFLATMSHEIRTPMNGIIGMADLLSQTELNTEQMSFVKTITESGESLLTIINDILDISRLDAGKMQFEMSVFEPKSVILSSVNLLEPIATKKGLELIAKFDDEQIPHLIGDRGRLRQILINLIGNAIKFTEQGHVSVNISGTDKGSEYSLNIAITDTGIGIDDNKQAKIFEMFSQANGETTRRFGGTGLGLSISRLLARQMNGDITLKSKTGIGSTFSFEISMEKAKEISSPRGSDQETMRELPNDLHIIVAEDNKTNRFLLRKILAPLGGDIQFADNGQIAVDMFQTRLPDLVLMDVSMPVMNGIEACKEIRAYEDALGLNTIPIVALTANAFEEDREKCLSAGMSGFLTKPIRKPILINEIARQLQMFEEQHQGRSNNTAAS